MTAPISSALVLTPSEMLAGSPAPVVRMHNHVRPSRIFVDLGGVPTDAPRADNRC